MDDKEPRPQAGAFLLTIKWIVKFVFLMPRVAKLGRQSLIPFMFTVQISILGGWLDLMNNEFNIKTKAPSW